MKSETCTIRSNGSRYYISMGAFRKTNTYSTPERAKKAAERMGYTVIGDLPDPNAISIARMGKVVYPIIHTNSNSDGLLVEIEVAKDVFLKGIVNDINPVLRKMGYKPVRITHNMLNLDFGYFLIDEDTPAYCDPGCESYHTM